MINYHKCFRSKTCNFWKSSWSTNKEVNQEPNHRTDNYKCVTWVSGSLLGTVFSPAWLSAAPWTVSHQASRSMEFSRQEYWRGLSFPPPGDLPDPEMEPLPFVTPALEVDSLPLSLPGSPCQLFPVTKWVYTDESPISSLFQTSNLDPCNEI